jgi:ketosteroid isomerase-like protein
LRRKTTLLEIVSRLLHPAAGRVRLRGKVAPQGCIVHAMNASTANKQLCHELFARFTAIDIDGVMDLMADDATWRVPGKPELNRSAGDYDKARLRRLFDRMLSQLDGGLTMTVLGTIAEDDRVAVEVESSGDLRNGRRYRQQYHFLITVRDGRIAVVREYLDTQHAFDVWLRPE